MSRTATIAAAGLLAFGVATGAAPAALADTTTAAHPARLFPAACTLQPVCSGPVAAPAPSGNQSSPSLDDCLIGFGTAALPALLKDAGVVIKGIGLTDPYGWIAVAGGCMYGSLRN